MIEILASADLETQISSLAVRTVVVSAIVLVVLTIIAVVVNKAPDKIQKYFKLPLFIGMAGIMAGSTLLLTGSTVYLNLKSDSGGPVHWHAGIEFWSCGAEINLRDPDGFLSNKVGSSTYHEHNDKFIHLEGVVVEKEYDASLEKFMAVTGGSISDIGIDVPISQDSAALFVKDDQRDGDPQPEENFALATNNGEWIKQGPESEVLQLRNGQRCNDNAAPAEVQVFVYSFNEDDDTYSQEKLEDPKSYVMRDKSLLGPPGDCVIVEYDSPKAATDKICEQYGIKDVGKCTSFGVKEYDPSLCYIREVNRPTELNAQDLPLNSDSPGTSNACLYDPANPQPCNDTPEQNPDDDIVCITEPCINSTNEEEL